MWDLYSEHQKIHCTWMEAFLCVFLWSTCEQLCVCLPDWFEKFFRERFHSCLVTELTSISSVLLLQRLYKKIFCVKNNFISTVNKVKIKWINKMFMMIRWKFWKISKNSSVTEFLFSKLQHYKLHHSLLHDFKILGNSWSNVCGVFPLYRNRYKKLPWRSASAPKRTPS